jgi:hypothetical protein
MRETLVGRSTGFSIGTGPVSDGVVEVDPLVFDQTHGDGWPIGFRAPEKSGLVFFEIIVSLLP